ncbi:50S ribosomal protein L25/general stress protein Ctc [Pelagibacteraceae bacterium]|nr:50S ribosomal protein L25/general stress protein Ctc [Candidatus Pelagibacter sp.]MDC1485449.1 50S ribosomal protein L25/general stress protein Ctc [Pelagibacteraceae bacterium]
MNVLEATIRNTKTKGEISSLRINGSIPAIVYGGSEANQKISLSTKKIKQLIQKENFLSNMISITIDGKTENVLPREVMYDVITDEPIHIDLLRIIKGAKIILEIPVKFINHGKSPGLKRGGVLNIVRRKVELKCPTEKIPTELVVDLENVDIGESFKISSIKLPENVTPTIQGRDFVVATLAAPTVIKEPEKPAETAEEGAEGTEGVEGETKAAEGAEGEAKSTDASKKDGDKQEDKKTPAEKK